MEKPEEDNAIDVTEKTTVVPETDLPDHKSATVSDSQPTKSEGTKEEPMDIDKNTVPSEEVIHEKTPPQTHVKKEDLCDNVSRETEESQANDDIAVPLNNNPPKTLKPAVSFLAGLFPEIKPSSERVTTSEDSKGASSSSNAHESQPIDQQQSQVSPEKDAPSGPTAAQAETIVDDAPQETSHELPSRRISPRLLNAAPETVEDSSVSVPSPPTTVSNSPKPTSMPKPGGKQLPIGGKQLPIAGKTIRQRKASSASPNGVEPKRGKGRPPAASPNGKPKKKPPAMTDDVQDGRNDFYCWICHKEGEVLCCELCPRVFHAKCLSMTKEPEGDWFCPECETTTNAECKETQSKAMAMLTLDEFSLLLKNVITRMKIPMSEAFHEPVDTKMFPDYREYVFHPMDLSTIEKNVRKRKYGCPEAFISEFKWVIHNCVIYNSSQSKLTQTARSMLKVAEAELSEMEVCPECYLKSCRKRDNWFCEPCKELHPLVWAKLQGFPHWPGKALRIEKGMVDVRFFGQHDRAWIPLSGCYLISKDLPMPLKNKKKSKGPLLKGGLEGAMQEMQVYIDNVRKLTGDFDYAPPKTLLTHIDMYGKSRRAFSSMKLADQSEAKSASPTTHSPQSEAKYDPSGKELAKARVADSLASKKTKTVTTSGEHPTRLYATKKKRASMEFLTKTIESCKASCGIDTLQDIKLNSTSEETTSSSSDYDSSEGKEKTADSGSAKSEKPSTSKTAVDDDSDAELVIDLGDMEEAGDDKKNKDTSTKTNPSLPKKQKTDTAVDKSAVSKPPLKSILHSGAKPPEKDERKKMLVKALSEKIGGKRKHDQDTGSSSAQKIRRTQEGQSPSQSDSSSRPSKNKDWKKSSLSKDLPVKSKSGILKNANDLSVVQRKEGGFERRISDQFKHKAKDGSYKSILKKPSQQDKSGRAVQMPTEADSRKLFNGGRIPRKNPTSTVADEEPGKGDGHSSMDFNASRSRAGDSHDYHSRSNTSNHVGNHRTTDQHQARSAANEDVVQNRVKKYSDRVMDTVQKAFREMYNDMMAHASNGAPESGFTDANVAAQETAQLRLEVQRLKWMHGQEIAELKHNHDLAVAEIRQSLEFEKKQMLLDAKTQADTERKRAIDETKSKQWCAYCKKEAIFYCCWNTSYCDYPCQQKHWTQHMHACNQADKESSTQPTVTSKASRQPASIPKTTQPMAADDPVTNKSAAAALSQTKISVKVPRSTAGSKTNLEDKLSISSVASIVCSVSLSKSTDGTNALLSSPITKFQKPSQPVLTQKSGGSTIGAIGARLLAAKQTPNPSEVATPIVTSKISNVSSSPTSSKAVGSAVTDHVKEAMESPLSPEPAPNSPMLARKSSTEAAKTACKLQPDSHEAAATKDKTISTPAVVVSSTGTTQCKPESAEVILSTAGSAFTKVVPEPDKPSKPTAPDSTAELTKQVKSEKIAAEFKPISESSDPDTDEPMVVDEKADEVQSAVPSSSIESKKISVAPEPGKVDETKQPAWVGAESKSEKPDAPTAKDEKQ